MAVSSTSCTRLVHLSASASDLWENYEQAKSCLACKKRPSDIETLRVYCNDRIDMEEVEVYEFDYDYTLEYLIHDIAKEHLVENYGYP